MQPPKILSQIEKGKILLEISPTPDAEKDDLRNRYRLWSDFNHQLLQSIFNTNNIAEKYYNDVSESLFSMRIQAMPNLLYHRRNDINKGLINLQSVFQQLEIFPESEALKENINPRKIEQEIPDRKKVFVVHGRNDDARRAMFRFLRAIGLEPTEWSQAVASTEQGSPYIGHILDKAFSTARAIVVLLTGDDLARLREPYIKDNDPSYERDPTPQARQNVLFGAGLALGRDPEHTILVQLGHIRPFSDLAGRHLVHLSNTPSSRNMLVQRLSTAGCLLDFSGTDWLEEGDFDSCIYSSDVSEVLSQGSTASESVSKNMPLSLNKYERRLLVDASKQGGRIEVLSTDQIPKIVRVGAYKFIDRDNPAIANLYYEVLLSLCKKGLVRQDGDSSCSMTSDGFSMAET